MRASVVQVTVAFILSGCGILPLRSEPAGRPLLQLRSPKRRKRRRPSLGPRHLPARLCRRSQQRFS